MRQTLKVHPDSARAAVTSLDVGVARPHPGLLVLDYVLTGAIDTVWLPEAGPPARADELWRRTCFEAFIKPADSEAYVEVNVAPSRQWAAYRFNGYRTGATPLSEMPAPDIDVETTSEHCAVRVALDLGAVADWPLDAPWRLGLSAVIEETNGRLSYWALTHPPGKADFHHASAFACEIRLSEAS